MEGISDEICIHQYLALSELKGNSIEYLFLQGNYTKFNINADDSENSLLT